MWFMTSRLEILAVPGIPMIKAGDDMHGGFGQAQGGAPRALLETGWFLAAALLLIAVVGSGIMAEKLSGGNVGIGTAAISSNDGPWARRTGPWVPPTSHTPAHTRTAASNINVGDHHIHRSAAASSTASRICAASRADSNDGHRYALDINRTLVRGKLAQAMIHGAVVIQIQGNFDAGITWADLEWIRAQWPGQIVVKDIRAPYYAALKKLVDFPLIAKSKLKFAHEALFGVGAGCFEGLLAGTMTRDLVFPTSDSRHKYPMFSGDEFRKNLEFVEVVRGQAERLGVATDEIFHNAFGQPIPVLTRGTPVEELI